MLSEVLGILTIAHFGPEQRQPLNREGYYLTFKYVELAPSSHFCVLYPWVLDDITVCTQLWGRKGQPIFFFLLHISLFGQAVSTNALIFSSRHKSSVNSVWSWKHLNTKTACLKHY